MATLDDLQFGLSLDDAKVSRQLKSLSNDIKSLDVSAISLQKTFGDLGLEKISDHAIKALNTSIKALKGDAGAAKMALAELGITASSLKIQSALLKDIDNDKVKSYVKQIEKLKDQIRDLQSSIEYVKANSTINIKPAGDSVSGFTSIRREIDSLVAQLAKARADIELYNSAIGNKSVETRTWGQEGLKEANERAERLMTTIQTLENAYKTLRNSAANIGDITGNTFNSKRYQDDMAKMREYYTQMTKDAAKAEKERLAAEKQRQNEIHVSEERIASLVRLIKQLGQASTDASSLRLDTSRIDIAYKKCLDLVNAIAEIQDRLRKGDLTAVGQLGHMGTGSQVTEIRDELAAQKQLNAEKERSVKEEQKHQQEIAKSAAKARADLVSAFRDASREIGKMSSSLQDLKSLFLQGGIVYGAQSFLRSVIETGGEMERQHIALQSILGDVQNANTMYGQIQELALRSPFTFSELNKDVKQLAAYGVEYENLYDTTKRLADMSAGLGVSFERIALAFGQVQARGWLDGKELRQIAYAGIPLLAKLSELYTKREGKTVSTSDIKKRISNREVGFEDVKQIFWDMTDVGGQFYNMQDTLSQTLLGRWLKLKDAWEIMLADFASGKSAVGSTLSFMIDRVTDLTQALHTLAPVVVAAFSGFAMKRMTTMLGGGLANTFLSSKSHLADDYSKRVMQGEQLSSVERNILATKGQITNADLRNLAVNNAISKTELQRLLVAGKITREQYKQTLGMISQSMQSKRLLVQMRSLLTVNYWQNFAARGGAALSLIGNGIAGLGKTLFSAVGGLPGILITGLTTAFFAWKSNQDKWKQDIEQTQEELRDRSKTIGEFKRDNPVNTAIDSGDIKEIDAAIDAYKEKLKEIAPYQQDAFEMKLSEISSHEERLRYLAKELDVLKEANAESQKLLANDDKYKNFANAFESAKGITENYTSAYSKARQYGAGKNEFDDFTEQAKKYEDAVAGMRETILRELGDISKSKALQGQAEQIFSAFFSQGKWDQGQAEQFRADVLVALGCTDDFYQKKFNAKLVEMVDKAFPEIGAKIRNDIPLDDAAKTKVTNMMKSAATQLQTDFNIPANELHRLLAAENFTATIRLAFATDSNDVQKQIAQNLGTGPTDPALITMAQSWAKGTNSWYEAKNKGRSAIDTAFNEKEAVRKAFSKGKAKKEAYDAANEAYKQALSAYEGAFGEKYEGQGKKSNKPAKTGRQEDTELKLWQERINAAKTFYQEYKKYKDIIGPDRAMEQVKDLYPEAVADMDVNDYVGSFQKIIDKLGDGWFSKSSERKKFLTSINKEIKEWNLEEVFRREADEAAAAFNEALERGISQFDLYKELLEKTGNKGFASQAFKDGAIWNDVTRGLAEEFREMTGEDVDLSATDAQAKHHLENNKDAYELWKKIVALVKGDYTDYLKNAADIIEKTADYDAQILRVQEKYDRLIEKANEQGDNGVAIRFRQQRDKEVGELKNQKFKNSADYLNFYGAIVTLGEKKAREIGANIRKNINEAFQSGAIDAREYTKEIQQLNEKLDDIGTSAASVRGNFGKGITGAIENLKTIGQQYATAGANKYGEAQKAYRSAEQIGDTQGMAYAKQAMNAGKEMQAGGEALFNGASEASGTISMIDQIIHGINDMVQGLKGAFDEIRETYDALGYDTESDSWQDANTFFSSFSNASQSATNGWDSLKEGNVGGVLQGVVGSFTGWISGFAQGHDKKLQHHIELSERQVKLLENISSNIESVLSDTLGGVYGYQNSRATTKAFNDMMKRGVYTDETRKALRESQSKSSSAYHAEYASLLAQRDELNYQLQQERDKKNSDDSVIADYKQQITELEQDIKAFSQDFLSTIYSIDLKSWASELTDAIVGAWENGEDAADAYHDKVRDLMKDLTTNIISQSVIEKLMEKPLATMTAKLQEKGVLEAKDVTEIADDLMDAEENAINSTYAILNALKERGLDLSEDASSSSTTKSIKSITEETADLLASYLNSIRADVSVNRENVRLIAAAVSGLPNLNTIAQSQLTQLTQLVTLANVRNEKLDTMYDWMRSVTTGTKKLYVA